MSCQSLSKLIFYIVINLFIISSYAANLTATTTSSSNEITIGMTAPLTGELQSIGKGEMLGVQIYFDKINAAGGLLGKKLKLIVLDDMYDPVKAAKNVHELLNKHIFAFMGNMGSSPAIATLPIIDQSKILLFAPVTGNAVYRKTPPDPYVFNFRASLNEETAALVNGVLSIGIKPEEIAFFTQQDSFGENVYQGGMKALKASGFEHPETLAYATFMRGTLNVEESLAHIMQYSKASPKAFILGGNYESNAKFIKLAKKEYPNALFLSVSDRINPANFNKAEEKNIITVELVPDINSNLPAVLEYRADLKKYGNDAKPNPISLEGYLSAKLFVIALQKAITENGFNTDTLIDILEKMHDVDIGIGIPLGFDKANHQALKQVWPVLLKNGKFVPFKWSDLK